MNFNVESQFGAVEHTVSSPDHDGQPCRAVTFSRIYESAESA